MADCDTLSTQIRYMTSIMNAHQVRHSPYHSVRKRPISRLLFLENIAAIIDGGIPSSSALAVTGTLEPNKIQILIVTDSKDTSGQEIFSVNESSDTVQDIFYNYHIKTPQPTLQDYVSKCIVGLRAMQKSGKDELTWFDFHGLVLREESKKFRNRLRMAHHSWNLDLLELLKTFEGWKSDIPFATFAWPTPDVYKFAGYIIRQAIPEEGDFMDFTKPWPISGRTAHLWMKLIATVLRHIQLYYEGFSNESEDTDRETVMALSMCLHLLYILAEDKGIEALFSQIEVTEWILHEPKSGSVKKSQDNSEHTKELDDDDKIQLAEDEARIRIHGTQRNRMSLAVPLYLRLLTTTAAASLRLKYVHRDRFQDCDIDIKIAGYSQLAYVRDWGKVAETINEEVIKQAAILSICRRRKKPTVSEAEAEMRKKMFEIISKMAQERNSSEEPDNLLLKDTSTVHPEAVIMSLYHQHKSHDTFVYIGTSKQCCWCCFKLAEILRRPRDLRLIVEDPLYPTIRPWAPPTGIPIHALEKLKEAVFQEFVTYWNARILPFDEYDDYYIPYEVINEGFKEMAKWLH